MHNAMAEESFKARAEAAAPGGNMSEEAAEELKGIAQQMGLPEETSQRILRGVTNKKLIGNMQSLKATGELTLTKVCSAPPVCPCSPACSPTRCGWRRPG